MVVKCTNQFCSDKVYRFLSKKCASSTEPGREGGWGHLPQMSHPGSAIVYSLQTAYMQKLICSTINFIDSFYKSVHIKCQIFN